MYIKRDNVRIKRIVLDLRDAVVDQEKIVSFNMKSFFYLELKSRRGVI